MHLLDLRQNSFILANAQVPPVSLAISPYTRGLTPQRERNSFILLYHDEFLVILKPKHACFFKHWLARCQRQEKYSRLYSTNKSSSFINQYKIKWIHYTKAYIKTGRLI